MYSKYTLHTYKYGDFVFQFLFVVAKNKECMSVSEELRVSKRKSAPMTTPNEMWVLNLKNGETARQTIIPTHS